MVDRLAVEVVSLVNLDVSIGRRFDLALGFAWFLMGVCLHGFSLFHCIGSRIRFFDEEVCLFFPFSFPGSGISRIWMCFTTSL